MLKLELDWASDSEPAERMAEAGWDDEQLFVEYDEKSGPAGWPTVRVYVREVEGQPEYMRYMLLDAWLREVYGEDEDGAQELAQLADVV